MSAQSTVTMSTTASTRVFLLPELLGSIISCLKKVDILTRAQRVSHTWKNAVASPQVQDKLWRGKGKKPAVIPIRVVNESTDNSLDDIGMPIYKMPIALNGFFDNERYLYQDCAIRSFLDTQRNPSATAPGTNHSRRSICMGSLVLRSFCCAGPAFIEDPTMPWHSMQICDPPITTAMLKIYSGEELGQGEQFGNFGQNYSIMTIYNKQGITMGLVHDTAADFLRTMTGADDPKLGWRLWLSYGIQDGPEGVATYGRDGRDNFGA